MALSSSIRDKIKQDTENKKKGIKEDASSSKAASGSENSQGSTSSTLSSNVRDRIANDVALKKMGITINSGDSRYDRIYQDASAVNGEYINQFLSDFNGYAPKAQKAYEGLGWKTATSGELDDLFGGTGDDLKYRAAMVGSYLASHKDDLDEESYNGLTSQLGSIYKFLNQYSGAYSSAKDFYAQFDNEDTYNAWQSKESQTEPSWPHQDT